MAGTAKRCISCLRTWSYLGWTLTGLIILSVFSAVSADDNDYYYDSEDGLDYYENYNIDQLLALRDPRFYEFNFDGDFLKNRLKNVAVVTNTSPKRFRDELRLLVGSVGAGFSSSPSPEIARLQRKFNISDSFPAVVNPSEGMQFPDTITLGRVALMFPQYFRFDLVKLVRKNEMGKVNGSDFNKNCQFLYEKLPGIIKHPEFAGLIPTSSGSLEKTAWKKLITAYFTWQICDIVEAEVAVDEIRKTVAIGLRRMQISRLPDALRVQFLLKTRELSDFNKIPKIDSAFDSFLPSFDESGEKIEFGDYKMM
nr:PREDICTED: uncharacterized protein LOC109034639 isoform X2 [Bemisia tabaci]XP_018903450.1 PREDICTED: uncharacterized protein LOC109034639 isoform X2 [Bemisia tabaci]